MVLELTIDRLKGTRKRIEKYVDLNLVQWLEEVGVPIVKARGFEKGLSNTSIVLIHAEKTGFLKAAIRWGLKTEDGKPLDLFLEEGTDPHDIEARFASFLKIPLENGVTIFRKKVRHPGTTAMNIFKDSVSEVEKAIESKISTETSKYLDGTRIQ